MLDISLGGGEASLNAIATGDKAITFNAAGINITDKIEYGGWGAAFNFYDDIVTAYQMTFDPLSVLQDCLPIPGPVGDVVQIDQLPNDDRNQHSILSMIDALKNYKK